MCCRRKWLSVIRQDLSAKKINRQLEKQNDDNISEGTSGQVN